MLTTDERHADCLARFKAAVRAHRDGNMPHVQFYLRGVEANTDRATAERQRTELVKYARSGKPA